MTLGRKDTCFSPSLTPLVLYNRSCDTDITTFQVLLQSCVGERQAFLSSNVPWIECGIRRAFSLMTQQSSTATMGAYQAYVELVRGPGWESCYNKVINTNRKSRQSLMGAPGPPRPETSACNCPPPPPGLLLAFGFWSFVSSIYTFLQSGSPNVMQYYVDFHADFPSIYVSTCTFSDWRLALQFWRMLVYQFMYYFGRCEDRYVHIEMQTEAIFLSHFCRAPLFARKGACSRFFPWQKKVPFFLEKPSQWMSVVLTWEAWLHESGTVEGEAIGGYSGEIPGVETLRNHSLGLCPSQRRTTYHHQHQ